MGSSTGVVEIGEFEMQLRQLGQSLDPSQSGGSPLYVTLGAEGGLGGVISIHI